MSDPWRWAARWRLLSAAAALWLSVAMFAGPFEAVFGARARVWLYRAGLSRLTQPENPAAAGFVLSVKSAPAGAAVWIDGVSRGITPLITNVACEEGHPVELVVRKDGLPPWSRAVACRQGRTLIVTAPLG